MILKFSIINLFVLLVFSAPAAICANQEDFKKDNSDVEARMPPAEKINYFKNQKQFDYSEDVKKQGSLWDEISRQIRSLLNEIFTVRKNSGIGNFLKFLIFGLIIAAFIYYMFKTQIGSLFGFNKASRVKGEVILPEENVRESDFGELIENAERNENYRAAARYMYLSVLKELDKNKHIYWKIDKTNWHYVSELKNSEYLEAFKELTFEFDRAWYGEIEIDRAKFDHIKSLYYSLINIIKEKGKRKAGAAA